VSEVTDISDITLKIDETPGSHFVTLRSEDETRSFGPPQVTWVNFFPAANTLARVGPGLGSIPLVVDQIHIYAYELREEDLLIANLQPGAGDMDVYVWSLETGELVAYGNAGGSEREEIFVDAPWDGVYIVEVYGYASGNYDLEVIVEGTSGEVTVASSAPLGLPEPLARPLGVVPADEEEKEVRQEPGFDLDILDLVASLQPLVNEQRQYLPILTR